VAKLFLSAMIRLLHCPLSGMEVVYHHHHAFYEIQYAAFFLPYFINEYA
jgi:hypothetical protein